ncbi:MAG: DegT/DnrJ/EryC1/StrS family aminotransferase [Candidatus Paceibacterota bacterium]
MLPRKKLDIGWLDLFVAAMHCCWPGNAELVQEHLQRDWAKGSSLACLSVRTGFDLLLSALDLPRGSEVILSAINIRDMVRIVQAHGLVPVPVDVDMETLSVDAANIERLVTQRTRVVVIAHLFGSRMPLEAIIEVGDRLGLLIVEDCAQAYVGNGERGHPVAHVRMFSFGPIKTSTALGGAMLGFRDPAVATAVRTLEAKLPRQTRQTFLARVLKYTMLKALLLHPMFTLFVAACRASGRSHDDVISGAVRRPITPPQRKALAELLPESADRLKPGEKKPH